MVINPIVGVYIPIIRIPIKGGMTIPNIATFDHGTNDDLKFGSSMFFQQQNTVFLSFNKRPLLMEDWDPEIVGNSRPQTLKVFQILKKDMVEITLPLHFKV